MDVGDGRFEPSSAMIENDQQYRETSKNVIDSLNCILSNARNYVNRIPLKHLVEVTQSQNTREGVKTLLDTSLPFKTSDYLPFSRPSIFNRLSGQGSNNRNV